MLAPKKNIFVNLHSTHNRRESHLNIYRIAASLCLVGSILSISDTALAAFDIEAAGKGIFNPMLKGIDLFHGIVIVASAIGGAIIGSGDQKTKWIGAGGGAFLGGLAVSGMKAGFGLGNSI